MNQKDLSGFSVGTPLREASKTLLQGVCMSLNRLL